MEQTFSSQEMEFGYFPSLSSVQNEGDNGLIGSNLDNFCSNVMDSMNFDAYSGWCNSPAPEQMFGNLGFSSPLPSIPNFEGLESIFSDQNTPNFPVITGDIIGSSSSLNVEKMVVQEENNIVEPVKDSIIPVQDSIIPRTLTPPLTDRLMTALNLFMKSSPYGILSQVWVPMKQGDDYILSTLNQPYILDRLLCGYRDISREFTFATESNPSSKLGLPGRVYNSRVPEWTSNLRFYKEGEYLRAHHAVQHQVQGSIALPLFEEETCCGVVEIVTLIENSDFDSEIQSLCGALQSVNLRSVTPPRLYYQTLTNNQKSALAEIKDVLRTVCHAHSLPLATTWLPCIYFEKIEEEVNRVRVKGQNRNINTNENEKFILCVEESACYVNDQKMQGFVHACTEHYLCDGEGAVGKALNSIIPYYQPDIKEFEIYEYPLVHHARKFGLNSAVAIKLRSTYTGEDDYILEFFLPLTMNGSNEQQLLLNNLSITMHKICKSLRSVSESEVGVGGNNKGKEIASSSTIQISSDMNSLAVETSGPHLPVPMVTESRKSSGKKRSPSEKHVSLAVIQQYFSGSLKDAARSIGVCPTTLKRLCRQYGISRWPSRKINKVNRSLKKIQTVIDSVQGVSGGGLKYDPVTGALVSDLVGPFVPLPHFNDVKIEDEPNCSKFAPSTSTFNNIPTSMPLDMEISIPEDLKVDSLLESDLGLGLGLIGHTKTTSSDSSNGSSSSSKSFNEQQLSYGESLTYKITVKVSYKEHVIRFKFNPSSGCLDLYEEVAKRFKLQVGTFQLKYLDDETEWVILVSDSDLHECLEILEFQGTRHVKFVVCDGLFPLVGSSGGSNGSFGLFPLVGSSGGSNGSFGLTEKF